MLKNLSFFPEDLKIFHHSKKISDFTRSFSIDMQVTDNDMDALGHMNNAVYVHWLDLAHLTHCFHLGVDHDVFRQTQCAMVVRHTALTYLSAAFLNDMIRVGTRIESCNGKLRLRRLFQMVRLSDDVSVLRGSIDYACINYMTGKPQRMPGEFIKAFAPQSSRLKQ